MYYIVAVIYLVAVAELQSKCLPIIELPDEGLTTPSLVLPPSIRSVQLFGCHPGGHNIYNILWLFEAKNIGCLPLRTIFSYGIQHIHISKIFVRKLSVNGISRYTLGPVFALLGDHSSVYTKPQQGCDTL